MADTKMTEEQQIVLLAGIMFVVACIVCYQFVWKTQLATLRTAGPAIARIQQQLAGTQQQARNVERLREATEARRAELDALLSQFAEGVGVDTLVRDLSQLAQDTHVQIESLEPIVSNPGDAAMPYREIPIQIWATGGFHQIAQFLNAMERHERLMRVVRLEIEGTLEEPWRQQAQMMVSTYELREASTGTPP